MNLIEHGGETDLDLGYYERFAENVLGIKNASSREFVKKNDEFIVDFMKEWKKNSGKVEKREKDSDLGGTLRLGIYDTVLMKNSLAHKLYKK